MKKPPQVVSRYKKPWERKDDDTLINLVAHEMQHYKYIDMGIIARRLCRRVDFITQRIIDLKIPYELRPDIEQAAREKVLKDPNKELTHKDGQRVDYQRMPVSKNAQYNDSWKLRP